MMDRSERPLLSNLYDAQPDQSATTICGLLKCIPMLATLAPDRLKELARVCAWRDVVPGTTVIRQGERDDALYVVLKGRLKVYQDAPDGRVLLGELRRNQTFGESAVLGHGLRTATVVAEDHSRLLCLSQAHFQSFLTAYPELRGEILTLAERRRQWADRQRYRPRIEELLARLAELTGVKDHATLAALENELDWITIPKGIPLIKTGDPGDHLFFVLAGALDVLRIRPDGSRARLGRVTAGDMVGEIALVTDMPRSADVIAAEDSELLQLSRTGYEVLVAQNPEAMKVLSRTLASRLVGQLQLRSMLAQISSMPLPTERECREIVETPDPILRNLRITQMYHRLSVQLAALLGQHDANWCTFATHASKTAGNSIRREELPGYGVLLWLEDRFSGLAGLCRSIDRLLAAAAHRWGIVARVEGVKDHVSRCIAAGNLKVFAELAPLFASFLRSFQDGQNAGQLALEEVCAVLEPGDTASGGQQLLREAFGHYADAMLESDAKRRSELLLLGNCKIGLHEQTRLQPYIVEALNTPIEEVLDPARKYLGARLIQSGAEVGGGLRGRLLGWTIRRWRRLLTRYMMRLRLPYGDISLGRDLPRLPNRRVFPDIFEELHSAEVRDLIARFDSTRGALRGSRARDWGDLDDRMNFIVNLFRSRHKSLELFDQPFFYEQRQAMQDGTMPEGQL